MMSEASSRMEHRSAPVIITPKPDRVVVNLELQVVVAGNAAHGSDNYHVVAGVKSTRPAGGDQVVVDVDRLVVSVAHGEAAASPGAHDGVDVTTDDKDLCVACREPMRWVAVGRCGHRAVCSKCMVLKRFFRQNRSCCICKTNCPKVLVAKTDRAGGGADALRKLPRFAFRDGRVGKYWYHGYTRAYFEEEKEYQAARDACEGIVPPFYQPLGVFVFWFGILLVGGVLGGYATAIEAKNLSSQVRAYALSIFGALFLATLCWSVPRCKLDPDELEGTRLANKQ